MAPLAGTARLRQGRIRTALILCFCVPAQVVEDALCLVFLQHQFADLLAKEGADKMVDVVRKTWRKMGEKGQAAALQLDLPADQADVVKRALAA